MFGHMILMAAVMGQSTVDGPRTGPGVSEQARKAAAQAPGWPALTHPSPAFRADLQKTLEKRRAWRRRLSLSPYSMTGQAKLQRDYLMMLEAQEQALLAQQRANTVKECKNCGQSGCKGCNDR